MSGNKDVDTPIPGQIFANFSYLPLKKPVVVNGNECFALFKIRGNHATERDAKINAEEIAKTDPKNTILVAKVGHWHPLTRVPLVAETTTVGEGKDANGNPLFSPDSVAQKQLREEERRKVNEIKQREKDLMEKTNDAIEDDEESIQNYIRKRIIINTFVEDVIHHERSISDLERKLGEVVPLFLELQKKNPQYEDEWIDIYSAELVKAGVPEYKEMPVVTERVSQFFEKYSSHGASSQ